MNTERHIGIGEQGKRQEDLIISAQSLIEDNHSPKAVEALTEFNEGQMNGDLTFVSRCSDARLKSIGPHALSIGSVAAGFSASERVLKDPGVGRAIVLTHFDSEKFLNEKLPVGCGGLAAKGNHGSIEGTEIEPWIDGYIADKDPVVQSLRVAEQIADISGKRTAAWMIDHLTDDIYPIAYFEKDGSSMRRISQIRDYMINSDSPERIYDQGIPTINEDAYPDDFRNLLDQNRREQQAILAKYPDLRKMQKIQNPRAVLFSTDIRSAKKFPELASVPGSIFKVFANREKLGDSPNITPESMDLAFRQLWYAISHSSQNYGKNDEQFSQTDRLIIETPDLNLSREVWKTAAKKPWMKDWYSLDGKKVILLQTNSGIVNDAAEIDS